MSIGKKSSQQFRDLVEAKLRHFPGSVRLLSLLPRPPQCLKTKLLIASFFCFLPVTAASYSRKTYNSKREQNFGTLPFQANEEFFYTTPSSNVCFWKCLIILYVVFNPVWWNRYHRRYNFKPITTTTMTITGTSFIYIYLFVFVFF